MDLKAMRGRYQERRQAAAQQAAHGSSGGRQGFDTTNGSTLSEQQMNTTWKYCVLIEFTGRGEPSFCSGVIFDVDPGHIFVVLSWHSVEKLRGKHVMKIFQKNAEAHKVLVPLTEVNIVGDGTEYHVAADKKDDWVMFKIDLVTDLKPPPLRLKVTETLKVHLFGFLSIGNLHYGASGGSLPQGKVIPAEVTQIQQGRYMLRTKSQEGLSGAAVVCDQDGGIIGICCGQWEEFRGFAISSHKLPIQIINSPPWYPDSDNQKRAKKKRKGKSKEDLYKVGRPEKK